MTNQIRLTEKPFIPAPTLKGRRETSEANGESTITTCKKCRYNLFLIPLAATTFFCLSTFATFAYSGVPNGSVFVETVNTAGTIRTGSQANFEAMLFIIANAVEIFGIAYGITRAVWGVKIGREGNRAAAGVIFGAAVIIVLAVGLPISIEWLVASGRPPTAW